MSWCTACAEDVACVASLNAAAQIVESCAKCAGLIGAGALSAPMAATGKVTGATHDERVLPVVGKRVADVVPIRPAGPAGHGKLPAPMATMLAPGDVIGQVRARLTYLEAEIAMRAGLEVEAKKLRKMLSAAERIDMKETT